MRPFLLAVLLIVPAFSSVQVSAPPGMGYDSGYVWINGARYPATLTLGGTADGGGFSFFTTDARCERVHYGVRVTFETFGSGYETYTGVTRSTKAMSGTSYSYYGQYGGIDTPLSIDRIEGKLKATVTNQNGTKVSYNFSASLY